MKAQIMERKQHNKVKKKEVETGPQKSKAGVEWQWGWGDATIAGSTGRV